MDIAGIYRKYQILPKLAEHQLRVAAVADLLCEYVSKPVDRTAVVTACLLHDMGNIIKFDFSQTQTLYPEITNADLIVWRKIQNEFKNKYGPDEHQATLAIAQEVGVGDRVVELIDSIGFNTAEANAVSLDFARKICAYSDMRVGPRGVIALEQRLADLRVRYDLKFHQMGGHEERRTGFENALREIEKQIFEHCSIRPENITEQAVVGRTQLLKMYQV